VEGALSIWRSRERHDDPARIALALAASLAGGSCDAAHDGESGQTLRLNVVRVADPHELDEVGASQPQQMAERRARGLALRGGHEPRTAPADPHLREQLCALGYLACDDAAQDQE
jgi:hypothetical protein